MYWEKSILLGISLLLEDFKDLTVKQPRPGIFWSLYVTYGSQITPKT
jgi:hypothetical protein